MVKLIPIRERKPSEDGFMLLAAMFLLFLLALSLSIAAPMIAKSIQRDRELETMERGKQYNRAIQLYFRKFNSYPPSIDALVKTNNIRFLRKKYIDPLTGKSDWKPIMFGQAKAPMAMGFFGEPLAGGATAMAGTGPSGGNGTPGAGFGGQSGGIMGPGSLFGSSPSSGTAAQGSTTGTSTGGTGTTGTGTTGTTNPGPGTPAPTLGGQTGQTFGGAGIVGVEPPVEKPSMLILKKKTRYNEWEFTYSPLTDQMKMTVGNAGANGTPASAFGSGQTGTPPTGFGSSAGSNMGFGSSSGSGTNAGSNGSPGAPPTQPQQ